MTRRGFPHSDIPGSKLVCSSPRLFAANRVLHRLLAPRHSPCALSSLTIGIQELTIVRSFALKRSRQSLFPPSLRNTARVLWIGKTTVCRIFSCKRTTPTFPPTIAATSVTANLLVHSRARPAPHGLNLYLSAFALRASARLRSRLACLAEAHGGPPSLTCLPSRSLALASASARRRLVENTGLEPVTSWLQTRRSPS
jgi:hypothetical protein